METTGNGERRTNTLQIRFREESDGDVGDKLAAMERGENVTPHFEIVYTDPAAIHRVTRPKNLELLRAIVQHEPKSIRETARLVDRDVRQVHRNLTELEELHLIDLLEDGQSKRPHVWYDGIDIDLPLFSTATSDHAEV